MSESFILPDWLEEYRVSDNILAWAYDAFDPTYRALIKTGIALAHSHFSENARLEKSNIVNPDAGFMTYASVQPLDWTILIFSQNCSGAAFVSSASIVPVLCGVSAIIAVCLSPSPPASLLAPLELCGIEDIFCLNAEKTQKLLNQFQSLSEVQNNKYHGTTIFLNQDEALEKQIQVPEQFDSFIHLKARPHIFMEEEGLLDKKLLRVMLGSHFRQLADPSLCEAAYVKNILSFPEFNKYSAPLILTPECAGFWLFPNLSTADFKYAKYAFSQFPQS